MKLRRLTHESIKPYGHIIDAACVRYKPGDNGFGIIYREHSSGWRVAYLVVKKRAMTRLENHPNTAETFEPVKGRAAIALASHSSPDKFKVFLLDRPVVLKKGVWHNVAALTKNCEIKICEGIKVREVYHELDLPVVPER